MECIVGLGCELLVDWCGSSRGDCSLSKGDFSITQPQQGPRQMEQRRACGGKTYQPSFRVSAVEIHSFCLARVQSFRIQPLYQTNGRSSTAIFWAAVLEWQKTRAMCVCAGNGRSRCNKDNMALKCRATWAPRGPCLRTEVEPIWDHIRVTPHEGVR